MQPPEQQARQTIDVLLAATGWTSQDHADFNRNAALGVAVREFSLPNGPCDYLLFIDGKAAGVIEAKKQGVTLNSIVEQSAKYMNALPEHLASWDKQLRYEYESTSEETFFCGQILKGFQNYRPAGAAHRSIYRLWRQVMDCVDAAETGSATATAAIWRTAFRKKHEPTDP